MSTTTSNGKTTAEKVVVLPSTIAVTLRQGGNEAVITAEAENSKRDNVWYEAKQQAPIAGSIEAVLATIEVLFNDEPVSLAAKNVREDGTRVITTTQPRLYKRGHPKAGQPMPRTGGNPSIAFYRQLDMGENGYGLIVTLTGVENNGDNVLLVRVQCSPRPAPRASQPKGHVSGTLAFGG